MRIVLSGTSSVGKTPVIEMLQDNLQQRGVKTYRVWGGGWVPASYGLDPKDTSWRNLPGIRETLTQHMHDVFQHGGWANPSDYMLEEMRTNPADVYFLDGIRNPHDLIRLLRPGDILILLPTLSRAPVNSFEEKGVAAICAYADFAEDQLGLRVIRLQPNDQGRYTINEMPSVDDLLAKQTTVG